MIINTDMARGVDVELTLQASGLTSSDLDRIVKGVQAEDMLPVTADDILGSYATYGAFVRDESDERRIVGFARQLHRDFIKVSDREELCVTELGTVWVDPLYRGRNIGSLVIGTATNLMKVVGFVPVAVCNEKSRSKFEAVGYTPVGTLPKEDGHDRVVEIYEGHYNWSVRERWSLGLKKGVLAFMKSLPRFQEMREL